MTTINLKDFYPWYTHDEYISVSDEVAAELLESRRHEAAHAERVRYGCLMTGQENERGAPLHL